MDEQRLNEAYEAGAYWVFKQAGLDLSADVGAEKTAAFEKIAQSIYSDREEPEEEEGSLIGRILAGAGRGGLGGAVGGGLAGAGLAGGAMGLADSGSDRFNPELEDYLKAILSGGTTGAVGGGSLGAVLGGALGR